MHERRLRIVRPLGRASEAELVVGVTQHNTQALQELSHRHAAALQRIVPVSQLSIFEPPGSDTSICARQTPLALLRLNLPVNGALPFWIKTAAWSSNVVLMKLS